jgi:hypothetical protein
VGEVVSLKEGYTDLLALLPAYLFHAVSTALGAYLIVRSGARKPTAEPKLPAAV